MEEPHDTAVVSAETRKEPEQTPAAATVGDEADRLVPSDPSSSTSAGANSNAAAAAKTPTKVESTKRSDRPDAVAANKSRAKAAKPKKRRRTRSRIVRTAVPAGATDSELSDDDTSGDEDSGGDTDTSSESDSDSDRDAAGDGGSTSFSSDDEDAPRKKKTKKKAKKQKKLKDSKNVAKKATKATKAKKAKKSSKLSKKSSKPAVDSESSRSSSGAEDTVGSADTFDNDASVSVRDLSGQLQALRLQFSALQQQVSAPGISPLPSGGYGLPPAGGLPGYLGGAPHTGGYPGAIPTVPSLSTGLDSCGNLDAGTASNPLLPPGGGRFRGRRSQKKPKISSPDDDLDEESEGGSTEPPGGGKKKKKRGEKKKKGSKAMRNDFKRVDWVWDSASYSYKLQDTAEASSDSQYDEYIFHVRRTFDNENKYRSTYVDIKSKLLRECLQDVMGEVRGISLVDETPKLDPNMLFLYLDELRTHLKHLKKARPAGDRKRERKRNQKRLDDKRKQLKVLIKYLDKDYAKTRESLLPMLENGLITFDLLWALWKPNTLAYTETYDNADDPRVFRVEGAERQHSIFRGEVYYVDGKYFEFDGKRFGYGSLSEEISSFQGARRITSLPCYPLQYHKDEAGVRARLIERGKRFVALSGMHYKAYSGMAYLKRKKGVVKFNIQHSRIMVDPAIFRRINPNYYVSVVRPKDQDTLSDGGFSDDDSDCCGGDSDDSGADRVRFVTKVFKDDKGEVCMARVPRDDGDDEEAQESLGELPARDGEGRADEAADRADEEYLIASPVVLGFAFSEKQWLEFAVSSVKDIQWNEDAWDSLVLEPETKDLVQALVQSRKYSAAQTIDDVIQGKGKGLVTVLHGPPGTGKTLTAEGISELLQCPLYMASAGELSTDSRFLESELQKILDICHAWGAILLLDEADVFLEKRSLLDIHRNALVSIFLRQLEYFQGILFLTTNRVETFDEAFQSRIHIALRYENLTSKAKRTIFKLFLDRVRTLGKIELEEFSDRDLDGLARHELNGREIKNVVGSAQDLAVNKGEALGMRHIRQVLDVHAKFGRDLKGGTGYEDAMRSYF